MKKLIKAICGVAFTVSMFFLIAETDNLAIQILTSFASIIVMTASALTLSALTADEEDEV